MGEFLLPAEVQEKLRRLIHAHEAETGERPLTVNVPIMPITFNGVKLHFYNGNKYFTCSEGKVVHHSFKETP